MTRQVRRHHLGLVAAIAGLAVMAPVLGRGFVLRYDMVFVPHPHPSLELLGVSAASPRAVPTAYLVAIAARALGGVLVQSVVLWGLVAAAVLGAGRLVPSRRPAARIGAGLLYAWNPMVYERLLLGQWAFLLGYAALPWVAGAAVALRRGEEAAGWRLLLASAAAVAASPYAGIFAALIAGAIALCPPWESRSTSGRARPEARPIAVTAGVAVMANLPWLVPALLGGSPPGDPALASMLFRARADSPVGVVGSLISLGGLWRKDLAPPGRGTFLWVPAFLLILGLCALGWRPLAQRWARGARTGLLALAGLGLLLAAAPSMSALSAPVRWLNELPWGGFLRDSQKFVVPMSLLGAALFGLGIERELDRLGDGSGLEHADEVAVESAAREGVAWMPSPRRRALAVILPLLPLALAPTLAWGAWGRLSTTDYPDSWGRVEAATSTAGDPSPGAIMVLPWHAYLPFGWNDLVPVRDPARLAFSRTVVGSTALEVGKHRLPPEEPWSALAEPAVFGSGALLPSLRSLGIRYLLIYREADWREQTQGRLEGLEPVLTEADLALYRVPGEVVEPEFDLPPRWAVVAADVASLVTVVVACIGVARSSRRRRT